MSTSVRRACAVVAGVVLCGLAACEATKPQAAPGALPARQMDAKPRLNASTYVAHGQLLERQGELERAADQYRQALVLTPDLVTAHNRLGITLNKLGQHAVATTEYRQALARHPKLAYLHNNVGFSLYLEQKYDEAERALATALELQPTFRRARMNHALVLARLERYADALQEFGRAGPETDAHYNLAVLQAVAGHYVDAVRSLDQALRLDPNFAEARDQLHQLVALAAAEEAAREAAARAAAPLATVADTQSVPPDIPAAATRTHLADVLPAADVQPVGGFDPGEPPDFGPDPFVPDGTNKSQSFSQRSSE